MGGILYLGCTLGIRGAVGQAGRRSSAATRREALRLDDVDVHRAKEPTGESPASTIRRGPSGTLTLRHVFSALCMYCSEFHPFDRTAHGLPLRHLPPPHVWIARPTSHSHTSLDSISTFIVHFPNHHPHCHFSRKDTALDAGRGCRTPTNGQDTSMTREVDQTEPSFLVQPLFTARNVRRD